MNDGINIKTDYSINRHNYEALYRILFLKFNEMTILLRCFY